MGGLYRLFTKILPIMMLICFISFGILNTFQTEGQANLTYLTQETYNIGTEENPEYKELYTFDTKSYAENINQDILNRSLDHVLTLEAYQLTLNKFQQIWDDGYNLFDISRTIANGVVLIINTIILPINILLIPLRIISGIILTGMSIVGINVNNGRFICPVLIFIIDKLAIPFIQPENPTGETTILENQQYIFKDNLEDYYTEDIQINFNFTCTQYNQDVYKYAKGLKITKINNRTKLIIISNMASQQWTAYNSANGWDDGWGSPLQITIGNNPNLSNDQIETIYNTLQQYGLNVTPKADTYWQFNNHITTQSTNGNVIFYYFSSYTSTEYEISYYGIKVENNILYYIDIDPNTNQYRFNIAYQNGTWTHENYKKIHITNQQLSNTDLNKINQLLLFNATQITE